MRNSITSIVTLIIVLIGCAPRVEEPDPNEVVEIQVDPPDARLHYTGVPQSVSYQAFAVFADGRREPLPAATFSLDARCALLGTIRGTDFTAQGQAAGVGAVIAQHGELTGRATVTVAVDVTDLGPRVGPDAAILFPDHPDVDPAALALAYPLDGAVMPSSVKAPLVQWEGPNAASDFYRVRMTAGLATVTTLLTASEPGFQLALAPDAARWQLLKSSVDDDEIEIELARWDGARAVGASPVTVRVVPADITGAIYYWDLDHGTMQRIDADGRSIAIASPPERPSAPGNRCVACHSVSRDGRFLAAALWDAGAEAAVFDMTRPEVRTADPAPTLTPVVEGSSYRSLFSTFNPDATRLMINSGTALSLLDPMTGQSVGTNGTQLPTQGASHPSWSPDGTMIALAWNITNNGAAPMWALDYDRGDLAIISASAGDTFAAPHTIVAATTMPPEFQAPSWPTFSPDSAWIGFGAGQHSRGRNDFVGRVHPGALFVVRNTGGDVQRLDVACSGGRNCHLPSFSPYDTGDHFWLVFYSTRPYGNALAGTKGTTRRQLWITAIDKTKLIQGGDPSSVPYWLPDQDVASNNMSAAWSLPAPIL